MESALISDLEAIAEIEDQWRALAERRGNAFLAPEWYRTWWAHRSGSITPLVVAVRRDDGALAGVMPLIFDQRRRPRMIRFAGSRFGDRFGPVAAEGHEAAVAAASIAALREAGMSRYPLVLNHVDVEGPWWRELSPASANGRSRIVQQRAEQPYIRLEGLDWEGYLASRSSNFRQQIRRRARKLRREHEVVARTATAETLERDLSSFFTLHGLRWAGSSSLERPGARPFLSTFAAAAQRRGWLRLRLLEVDGEAVAAFFGWRLGDTYAYYNSGIRSRLVGDERRPGAARGHDRERLRRGREWSSTCCSGARATSAATRTPAAK